MTGNGKNKMEIENGELCLAGQINDSEGLKNIKFIF